MKSRFGAVGCALILLAFAHAAQAHHLRRTALYVDFGSRTLALEVHLPLEALAAARGKAVKLTDWQVDPAEARELADYLRAHLSVRAKADRAVVGSGGGAPFALAFGSFSLDPDNFLIVAATARGPGPDSTRALELRYDAISDRVREHETYVFVRRDLDAGQLGDEPKLFGTLSAERRSLMLERSPGSFAHGFAAVFQLGISHIQQGTDHLLFLLMLLLPAPLFARGRRWAGARTVWQSLRVTFGIVTAFTLGHSLTLIAGAVRGAALPVQPVEVLIAISILASAIHAFRPIFAGREMLVAAGFGLIHGLAFARELLGFGYDGRSLALALFGFNLGIEAMQLVIVLLVMPWLLLASRSRLYAWLRIPAAAIGGMASAAWILERGFGIRTRVPLLIETAAAHAGWLLVALACFAALASGSELARTRRRPLPTQ